MSATHALQSAQVVADQSPPGPHLACPLARRSTASPKLCSVWLACLLSGLLLSSLAAWRCYQAPIGSGTDRALRTEVLAAAVGLCLGLSWVFILLIPIQIASRDVLSNKNPTHSLGAEPKNPPQSLDSPNPPTQLAPQA